MPIRVLLIAPSLDILGGQAVQATRLLEGFASIPTVRVDFQPINPRLPGWLRRIRYARTASNFALYFLALLWRIPRYRVLHIFSASSWSYTLWSLPAILLGRLFGKQVVLNYRDGQVEEHLTRWRSALPTIRLAHRVVSPSDYVVEVFRKHGLVASRIYNVLALERFPFKQRSALRPRLFTNRILEPLYNVACILKAYRILQERYLDTSLVIAHDGPSRPQLERLAKDLKLRDCKFVGRIPHERMSEFYADADIYLTTPDWDCMPGSLLECFASGLPVIATRVGGIPYIVENEQTGLLIERDDHKALAAATIRLVENDDLAQGLIAEARRECEKYDWGIVSEQWLYVYRQLQ